MDCVPTFPCLLLRDSKLFSLFFGIQPWIVPRLKSNVPTFFGTRAFCRNQSPMAHPQRPGNGPPHSSPPSCRYKFEPFFFLLFWPDCFSRTSIDNPPRVKWPHALLWTPDPSFVHGTLNTFKLPHFFPSYFNKFSLRPVPFASLHLSVPKRCSDRPHSQD